MTSEKKARASLRPFGFLSDIYDIIETFAFCAVGIMLVFIFIFRLSIVSGESMEKTLHEGEFLVVSDLGYEPKRNDIVIAQNISLDGQYSKPLVKRVIAVAGDTVEFQFNGTRDWKLIVNGEEVDQSYAYFDNFAAYTIRPNWDIPKVIPEGKIFVMGDNRNHSADSRSYQVGLIDERCIVGHALFRLLPIDKASSLLDK